MFDEVSEDALFALEQTSPQMANAGPVRQQETQQQYQQQPPVAYPDDEEKQKSNIGLIIGIIGGVVAILGVVAGSAATWLRQRHWRRAARQHEAEAAEARTRLAELQATTAPRGAVEPALLPYFGGPEAARRDKHGATL